VALRAKLIGWLKIRKNHEKCQFIGQNGPEFTGQSLDLSRAFHRFTVPFFKT
jgi:hypothetical protein